MEQTYVPYEFNQPNLRFLVKNTLLNNSHLEQFDTVCTPFPMERHIFRDQRILMNSDFSLRPLLVFTISDVP